MGVNGCYPMACHFKGPTDSSPGRVVDEVLGFALAFLRTRLVCADRPKSVFLGPYRRCHTSTAAMLPA